MEAGAAGQDGRVVCRFPAPAGLSGKHVRLETACNAGLTVNGTEVLREEGLPALTPYLSSRGPNEISLPAGCLPVALLVTPKVFLSSLRAEPGSGRPLAMVENTLDNTVNVSVACRLANGPEADWRRAGGTVAAGGRQELALDGPLAATNRLERMVCRLDKQAEAVEESYTFETVLNFQSLTKNGRANIR
ncbi:hypothetical protein [Paludibaculum fermentans]|uniref:Uncharacterized protein n=1 Tax=Paludibaculum fermentans TaxID=1473598 RepID=A0A7S7NQY7_PALFE|nr:hypothetical protein [Paludibaculum fermentans]QOY88076.1 hypothetical protein IRI77_35970 [Paludibaculum fermentans]